ncbi:2-hydroxyacid dehydrogenase [Mycolicibacterium cosmeticum]|uniref:D-isomer specific 2-hydroxyacid dehydrogenase n=1 Tax=Mycolicibacterium cosmeticum TaxID=258533 RepID=W9AYF3_MYCCO|nr:2-hydroxyacid dehydrogenase [Mycolicibacterium cosmeticum]TLH80764.1 2-hydroxyacid dehydrogenase [Mycolicibacterium cosmeticum]CDO07591.1 D-isomer specific 2-hydroxyacid dehydrogenase [Mycolicibacterium cosmeticum]
MPDSRPDSRPDSAPRAVPATPRVLQVGPLKDSLAETLQAKYDALVLPSADGAERAGFLATHGADVTAVVTSGRTGVDAALMAALPALGAVINFGVGYDTTDVDAAAAAGIGVSNTPDVLTDCVADTAVGLLIDVLRRFTDADRYLRAGRWTVDGNYPLTRQVSNTRVGIIGMGRIGGAIAKRLSAFGCTIGYHNRHRVPDSPYRYAATPVDLARDVDVLVVAAAGGDGTRGLVSADVLDALGPEGYLINIARGSVVDEAALVTALQQGRLAGAGLDVFVDEPNVPVELLRMDNVVLLPHVGSGTVQTRAAMEALTLRNLDEFLATGRLVTPVLQPGARV